MARRKTSFKSVFLTLCSSFFTNDRALDLVKVVWLAEGNRSK